MNLSYWSPVGLIVANLMSDTGESEPRLLQTCRWWFHLSLVMVFILSIPYTRFRHIFTIALSMIPADWGSVGKMGTIDLENEGVECFGAVRLTDLTWKDIFDTDACNKCRHCQDWCPDDATAKRISPMRGKEAGGVVAEVSGNRDQALCCNAGGGRMLREERRGSRINIQGGGRRLRRDPGY